MATRHQHGNNDHYFPHGVSHSANTEQRNGRRSLKLNEIVAAIKGASNRLIDLEDWTEEELVNLHQHYRRLAELARTDPDTHRSLSVDSAEEATPHQTSWQRENV
jgi:hypothetical protein